MQRMMSHQETRTATIYAIMSSYGQKNALLNFTIVLPCGFLNQTPTSACLIYFPNATQHVWLIGG